LSSIYVQEYEIAVAMWQEGWLDQNAFFGKRESLLPKRGLVGHISTCKCYYCTSVMDIYPTIDVLDSTLIMLQHWMAGKRQYKTAQGIEQILYCYKEP